VAEPEGPDEPLRLQQAISSSTVVVPKRSSPGTGLTRYIGSFWKHAPEGPQNDRCPGVSGPAVVILFPFRYPALACLPPATIRKDP
jgi:hypothetical protein